MRLIKVQNSHLFMMDDTIWQYEIFISVLLKACHLGFSMSGNAIVIPLFFIYIIPIHF